MIKTLSWKYVWLLTSSLQCLRKNSVKSGVNTSSISILTPSSRFLSPHIFLFSVDSRGPTRGVRNYTQLSPSVITILSRVPPLLPSRSAPIPHALPTTLPITSLPTTHSTLAPPPALSYFPSDYPTSVPTRSLL